MTDTEAQVVTPEGLVPGRECGDCDVCCSILKRDKSGRKQAGDADCPHHIPGKGCAIYDTRPAACRAWHCAWRRFGWLPDECRPDHLGVMLTVEERDEESTAPEHCFVLGRAIEDESAYKTLLARDVFWSLMQEVPVWVEIGNQRLEYGGPRKFIDPRFL